MGLDGLRHLGYQRGAFVDQAGVQLHGVCTRFNLGHGIFPAQDAARANDGKARAQHCAQRADDAAAGLAHGRARKAARLLRVGLALHGLARERGVGGNHAIHAVLQQRGGDGLHLRLVQIRRDLQKKRHVAAMRIGQLALARLERRQQRGQRLIGLQVAQVPGVGTGNVHCHVVGMRIHGGQAHQIVVLRPLHWRGGVLADVQAQRHARRALGGALPLFGKARRAHVRHESGHALIVEAHAVDERLRRRQPEQARPGIARLRQRRDGARFHKAKAHARQRVNAAGVLVQPRRQAHAVGQRQARQRHGVLHARLPPQKLPEGVLRALQRRQRFLVGRLGVHAEQSRTDQAIRQKRHFG